MTRQQRLVQAVSMLHSFEGNPKGWARWFEVWFELVKGQPREGLPHYDPQFTCDCGRHVRGCGCQERIAEEVTGGN